MKKIALIPALAMVMFGFNVQAKFGAQDNVPAATLLLPHFDVDMNSSSGMRGADMRASCAYQR